MSYQDPLSGDDQLQHEVEDEISLCDFALCSHDVDSRDHHPEHHDPRDQEFFEFFTQDFSACASTCPAENIIFCGKVFSNKTEPCCTEISRNQDEESKQNQLKKMTIFNWRSNKSQDEGSCSNTLKNLKKATDLAAPIKSDKKYPMAMLGLTKLPLATQLRDIKTRQSRQNPTRMLGLFESSADMVRVNRGGGRWLWILLGALGLGYRTGHANAVVKATFGCL